MMLADTLVKARITDHTHTMCSTSPGLLPDDTIVISPYGLFERDGYVDFKLSVAEHFATHIDAPFHFGGPGHFTVDEIPVTDLIGPAVVIDVREEVEKNNTYRLSIDDLVRWERHYGDIPAGAIVIMFSGWQERWDNPDEYGNMRDGCHNFPGFSVEALAWLLANRDIKGIGVDTLSFDHGPSKDYPAHELLLKANKWALENLCNLDLIPPKGAVMVVSPIKHKGGSGGPARVYTLVED
jgi:kynurenine formamidase